MRAGGDAKRGEAIYLRAQLACVACHSLRGQGGSIGPPLDNIGSGQPLDFIIGAVLAPQREVKEGYEAIEVQTKDGRTILGYRMSGDESELLLRDVATGQTNRIGRDEISTRRNAGSVMPVGLVDQLSREELRDLFAFLGSRQNNPKSVGRQSRQPGDPRRFRKKLRDGELDDKEIEVKVSRIQAPAACPASTCPACPAAASAC